MIVVAIIGVLATLALPNFMRARRTSQLTVCLNDLRIYQDALEQYIFAHRQYPTDLGELVTESYLDRLFKCPVGGAYEWSVKNGNTEYHLLCGAQHTPAISHVCIHEDQPPEAK
jgi:competence protein ComGC